MKDNMRFLGIYDIGESVNSKLVIRLSTPSGCLRQVSIDDWQLVQIVNQSSDLVKRRMRSLLEEIEHLKNGGSLE
jgi:hypothetical protein